MNYIQEPEKSDLSCEGCVFNKELFTSKYKLISGKYVQVGKESKHQSGCYAPFQEPYMSCKKNHIIFKTDGQNTI